MEERTDALQTESLPQPALYRPLKWHKFLIWVFLWIYAAYLVANGVNILTRDAASEIDNWALMTRFMPSVQWLKTGMAVFLIVLAAAVIVVRFMLARRVRGARMALYIIIAVDVLWWPLIPLLVWLSMRPMTALSGSTPAYLYAEVYGLRLWIGPAVRTALLALHMVYYHKRSAMFAQPADGENASAAPAQPGESS